MLRYTLAASLAFSAAAAAQQIRVGGFSVARGGGMRGVLEAKRACYQRAVSGEGPPAGCQ